MKKIGLLCIPIIKDLGLHSSIRLAKIKNNWSSLFKKPLCYHMSPCMLSNSEILINVDSPAWLQELQYYKEDIIKKLSPYGIKSVRFKIGRVPKRLDSDRKESKDVLINLTTEEINFIESMVSRIHDEDLKETVQRAIKKSLIADKIKK